MFFVVNFVEKHIIRTTPETTVAIERAVDDHFLLGLGVIGDVLDDIEVAFEVTINAVEFKSIVDFVLHMVNYSIWSQKLSPTFLQD